MGVCLNKWGGEMSDDFDYLGKSAEILDVQGQKISDRDLYLILKYLIETIRDLQKKVEELGVPPNAMFRRPPDVEPEQQDKL